jgi:creatinine amidohydrolase
MDLAEDVVPNIPRPYLSYGSIFRATPSGAWGEPTKATAEKGEKAFERSAELAVEQIQQAFAYMEKKEKFNYSWF